MSKIEKVCVVGAGYMGSQIGLQCAAFGYQVSIQDLEETALSNGRKTVEQFLAQMRAADYRPECLTEVLQRINFTTSLDEAVHGAALVIEAVKEDLDTKHAVFRNLAGLCGEGTILATNSSSLRISRIETALEDCSLPALNTHFVQPVWKHPFVELMRGTRIDDEQFECVQKFMQSIGMLPIIVRKESTGFVFNRIWRAVKKEALRVVDDGIASVEDIDRTWMIQMETPMGPLATMDVIGLDVIHDIEMVYFEESGDPSDAPPQILKDKIAKGQLGVKTGKGFYDYPNPSWEADDFLRPEE